MKILYLGDDAPGATSRHRASALGRLGHEVILKNPFAALSNQLSGRIRSSVHFRTGYRLIQTQPFAPGWSKLLRRDTTGRFDLIWIDGGELFGKRALRSLRQSDVPIVLFNHDDPTGGRDGRRFDSLLEALPAYDLCTVVREPNIDEFKRRGARAVHRVFRGYDEVAPQPF